MVYKIWGFLYGHLLTLAKKILLKIIHFFTFQMLPLLKKFYTALFRTRTEFSDIKFTSNYKSLERIIGWKVHSINFDYSVFTGEECFKILLFFYLLNITPKL